MRPELRAYTREVLSFRLGPSEDGRAQPPAPPGNVGLPAERIRRAWARERRPRLLLVGLGSGHLARELARLVPEAEIAVCETDPDLVRAVLHAERDLPDVLADTSLFAHLLLLDAAGFEAGNTFCVINPELAPSERKRATELFRLFSRARPATLPAPRAREPVELTVAAILSPDEPGLDDFLAQIPHWITQVVAVWDTDDTSRIPVPPEPRRVDVVHPLEGDFAAQRNRMLAAATGEWLLYLDADERLAPETWALLPALTRAGADGICFPRRTFYPDRERCKIGYGLWPDLQLRLLRNLPGVRFVRPVHELVEGLPGPRAVVLHAIGHESRLRKDRTAIEAKLAGFDRAAAGVFRHGLSDDYPTLACEALPGGRFTSPPRLIMLPDMA